MEAILAENKDLSEKLAKAATDAVTQQKAVEAADKNTEEAKKEAEKTKKDLEAAQKDLTTTKDDLEAKKKDLTRRRKTPRAYGETKDRRKHGRQRGRRTQNVAAALTPKFLKPEAGDAALLPAVKNVVRLAAITDPQGDDSGFE